MSLLQTQEQQRVMALCYKGLCNRQLLAQSWKRPRSTCADRLRRLEIKVGFVRTPGRNVKRQVCLGVVSGRDFVDLARSTSRRPGIVVAVVDGMRGTHDA